MQVKLDEEMNRQTQLLFLLFSFLSSPQIMILSNVQALSVDTLLSGLILAVIRADPLQSFIPAGKKPCVMDSLSSKILPTGVVPAEFAMTVEVSRSTERSLDRPLTPSLCPPSPRLVAE